jgi:eukaryotic-like serine/threonine-protein kinase
MPLHSGARLGPYQITAHLGSGGMGDLYSALDTRLNRPVAIKLLKADVARDDDARRRLDREARAIGALAHPHICVLYEVAQHDGATFLVLEHLQGETLAARLARGPLPVEEAVRFAHQIAQALDAAHRQGVLHRDLNPNNVMVVQTGVKLLDFGIAAVRPETLPDGDPYMAPERVEGRAGDTRTDVFAFGAVFFEMLTGRRAFEGNGQAAVLAAIMNTPPRMDERLPAEFNRIIRRCLARDPEERWQSARDLAEVLSLVADYPPPAPVTQPSSRGWRWLVAALLGLVLAAIVIGFCGRRTEGSIRATRDQENSKEIRRTGDNGFSDFDRRSF